MSDERNYHEVQLHAGIHPARRGEARVFHTDCDGRWWCGWHLAELTAEQLISLCRSTEADLLRHYPELAERPELGPKATCGGSKWSGS